MLVSHCFHDASCSLSRLLFAAVAEFCLQTEPSLDTASILFVCWMYALLH
jgi:hypothetical protein